MLQVHDIRETRVYQEAKEEGKQEGVQEERQRHFQEKLGAVVKMAWDTTLSTSTWLTSRRFFLLEFST